MLKRAALALAILSATACASRAPGMATTITNPARTTTTNTVTNAHENSRAARELGPNATFADLVRAARFAIQSGHGESDSGCMLGSDAQGFVLDADLMPALDPLPDVAPELDPELQRAHGALRVLTPWGQVGSEPPELVLAAFTALTPDGVHAAGVGVILTDEGVYLRYSDAAASDDDGPVPTQRALERLRTARAANATLYISAEAASPVRGLVELLRALPQDRAIALGLLLPEGTRLPANADAPAAALCPDGLPEPATDRAQGDLAVPSIMSAIAPLRPDALRCLQHAVGAARAGAHLALAIRVAENGAVEQACCQQDALASPELASCVLESARKLRFPTPSPPGFVDLRLPLALTAVAPAPAPRALCAATSASP